jgi:hypothetical protein
MGDPASQHSSCPGLGTHTHQLFSRNPSLTQAGWRPKRRAAAAAGGAWGMGERQRRRTAASGGGSSSTWWTPPATTTRATGASSTISTRTRRYQRQWRRRPPLQQPTAQAQAQAQAQARARAAATRWAGRTCHPCPGIWDGCVRGAWVVGAYVDDVCGHGVSIGAEVRDWIDPPASRRHFTHLPPHSLCK